MFRRGTLGVVIFAALALCLAGCTSRDSGKAPAGAAAESSTADPVEVAILTSQTGPLAAYGHQYLDGFKAGLDYATEGTGKVGGRKIAVTYVDDQGKPATAVARFKGLVGKGYRIIAGTASSGVALRLAPLAAQNKVLYIAGPVAADKITGINKRTFRSGRQSWQDVETAKSLIGDAQNQKVVVFAQDYAFGKANVAAVQKVLGGAGAHVSAILVPLSTTDFTPFALKVKQAQPDLLFVAWAGASTASVWEALAQQGVFNATTVVTGLAGIASYPLYGPAAGKIDFLSYYFSQAPHNPVNTWMVDYLKKNGAQANLFSPDGFVAAQMIVHAIQASPDDVPAMVSALEGWTFKAPKGQQTIRASDHAMLQPMYVAKLIRQEGKWVPKRVKTLPAEAVAPPAGAD